MRMPSPAMVVAFIALAVALTGTAYAAVALPRDSVGAKQIRRGAVRSAELAGGAVTSSKVRNGSLRRRDFAAGQVPAAAQGPKGDKGDPGPKGDRGDVGPSAAFEAVNATPAGYVTLPEGEFNAKPVVTLAGLPAGAYLVTGSMVVTSAGSGARAVCRTTLGAAESVGVVEVGNTAGHQGQTMMSIAFTSTTTATGDAVVSCWTEGALGAAPFAGLAHLTALRVGSVSAKAVTS